MSRTHTVLIADDEATIARLYGGIMVQCGYDIVLASDGEEALEKARAARPSLILTDVQMPRLGGIGFLEQISALHATGAVPRTPVLMLSADLPLTVLKAGLNAGADGFLIKGAPLNHIRQMTQFWLGSGFAALPSAARQAALDHLSAADQMLADISGKLAQAPGADPVTIWVAECLADVPVAYGDRLVERILLTARISGLLTQRFRTAADCLRFPLLLVAVLNRMERPWVRDAHLLFRRFDQLADDPRFREAYAEGLGSHAADSPIQAASA